MEAPSPPLTLVCSLHCIRGGGLLCQFVHRDSGQISYLRDGVAARNSHNVTRFFSLLNVHNLFNLSQNITVPYYENVALLTIIVFHLNVVLCLFSPKQTEKFCPYFAGPLPCRRCWIWMARWWTTTPTPRLLANNQYLPDRQVMTRVPTQRGGQACPGLIPLHCSLRGLCQRKVGYQPVLCYPDHSAR